MNVLIVLIGESFRTGRSRIVGEPESYDGQMDACNSHIRLIEHMTEQCDIKSISVALGSCSTNYDDDLRAVYSKYLTSSMFIDRPEGLIKLFSRVIRNTGNIDQYDAILYIRIDIFLKQRFIDIFAPTRDKLLCMNECHNNRRGFPRIVDMMLFIPKQYLSYIKIIGIHHKLWIKLMSEFNVSRDKLTEMLPDIINSNTEITYHPLFYIVNRPQYKLDTDVILPEDYLTY